VQADHDVAQHRDGHHDEGNEHDLGLRNQGDGLGAEAEGERGG